jgi:hypothetical protein
VKQATPLNVETETNNHKRKAQNEEQTKKEKLKQVKSGRKNRR